MGRHKKVSDSDVLAVARAAFAQYGHSASTRQIAEDAGLSQAALVQRFGGKQRLFIAASSPSALDVAGIVGGLENANVEGGIGHVTAIAMRLHQHLAKAVPQIVQLAGNSAIDPELVNAAHARLNVPALIGAWVGRVAALQKRKLLTTEVDPSATVEALLIAIHGLVFMSLASPHSPSPFEAMLEKFVKTLLHREANNVRHTKVKEAQ